MIVKLLLLFGATILQQKYVDAVPVIDKNCTLTDVEMDVMFVLDGSGSVGSDNFEISKDWVVNVTETFDLESGKIHVGLIQYSYWYPDEWIHIDKQPYVKTEIELGSEQSFESFKEKVSEIELQGFTTYTAHALEKAGHDFKLHGRDGAKKVMVLLTDGEANDSELLPQNAQALRDEGVATIAVGIGDIRITELRIIATGDITSDERVYDLTDFDQLQSLVVSLGRQINCVDIVFPVSRNDTGSKAGTTADPGTEERLEETTVSFDEVTESFTTEQVPEMTTTTKISTEREVTADSDYTTEPDVITLQTTTAVATGGVDVAEVTNAETTITSRTNKNRGSGISIIFGSDFSWDNLFDGSDESANDCSNNCGWLGSFNPLKMLKSLGKGCYNGITVIFQQICDKVKKANNTNSSPKIVMKFRQT